MCLCTGLPLSLGVINGVDTTWNYGWFVAICWHQRHDWWLLSDCKAYISPWRSPDLWPLTASQGDAEFMRFCELMFCRSPRPFMSRILSKNEFWLHRRWLVTFFLFCILHRALSGISYITAHIYFKYNSKITFGSDPHKSTQFVLDIQLLITARLIYLCIQWNFCLLLATQNLHILVSTFF